MLYYFFIYYNKIILEMLLFTDSRFYRYDLIISQYRRELLWN